MGKPKKLKKKCCLKFEKKGTCCPSCPLTGHDEAGKSKKEKKDKKKEKK